MKQKLISKLKRVALALFAALCVGNVWAEDIQQDVNESGIISLKAQHNYMPEVGFSLMGTYDTTVGISAVKINYAVNSTALSESVAATLGTNDGTFSCTIPLSSINSTVTYQVIACYNDGTEKTYLDLTGATVTTKSCRTTEVKKTIYTWTGKGDGVSWKDVRNWDANHQDETVGYPGAWNGSWYWTIVNFTNSVECINLHGDTYGFVDNGAFSFSDNISVKFSNGRFEFTSGNTAYGKEESLGGNGTVITFDNVALVGCNESRSSYYTVALDFAKGATIILNNPNTNPEPTKKTDSRYIQFHPRTKDGTKFVVQNGSLYSSYDAKSFTGVSEIMISNATWQSKSQFDKSFAGVMKFRDGPNRQGRFLCEWGTTDHQSVLPGVCDFKLGATIYDTPYFSAGHLKENKPTEIRIDVTAYSNNRIKVPLLKFSNPDTNTRNAMNTMCDSANNKLKVYINEKEVDKSVRNSSLVWENNILYYQQTEPKVAAITKTETDDAGNETEVTIAEYATLGDALEAATDGATIKVLNDVEITSYLQITKSLTLNLNGKSITRTDSTDNSTALFVNAADAIVTITGDGTVTADHAVYVNAGKVVIENGTFSAGSHAVYVINNGNAEIKGGTFSSEAGQYHYALNEYDQTRDATSIVVTGGTFVGFNPANNTAEGDNTNFCADGYTAVAGEEEGTWVVQKAISDLKPGVPVTNISATTEEEAIGKVKLTVEVPENANVTKDDYAKYFKLVAAETSEGSGVWEVAAVLDDTKVTPVIAETTPAITFKDGEVTVNIKNELPGLYYGVRYATTVEAVETTAPVSGFTVTPAAGDTAGFFKVVVDFKPIPEAE